jgi:putative transposase
MRMASPTRRNRAIKACSTAQGRHTTHVQGAATLKSAGVEPLRLPARSPNLNAFAERFVRSVKESCVERMIFFGESALRRAVAEFALHYHTERNHQGLENKIIQPELPEFPDVGIIRSR